MWVVVCGCVSGTFSKVKDSVCGDAREINQCFLCWRPLMCVSRERQNIKEKRTIGETLQ